MTIANEKSLTETVTTRTYYAVLYRVAPYPLSWDTTEQLICETIGEAMAKVEEWKARYPKGFASRTRWAIVISDTGTGDDGRRIGFKTHLNTKKSK